MHKASVFALVSCMTLASAAMAQTATTPSTSASSATTATSASSTTAKTTTAKKTTHHAKKTASHTVTGEISKLDCPGNALTVKTTDLVTTDKTKITLNGKKAACTELHDGDTATAHYTMKDGKNTASSISAKSKKM